MTEYEAEQKAIDGAMRAYPTLHGWFCPLERWGMYVSIMQVMGYVVQLGQLTDPEEAMSLLESKGMGQ